MHRKVRYDIDKPGCTTAKIKVRYYFKKYLGIYYLAEVDIMYINIYRNLPTTKEKSMKKWVVDSLCSIYIPTSVSHPPPQLVNMHALNSNYRDCN